MTTTKVIFTTATDEDNLNTVNLHTFNDFWTIESNQNAEKFGIETKRSHKVRGGNEILRETCQLDINGEIYFLKRSSGKSFSSVINELEARKILPNYNLTSSTFAAYAIDKKNKNAFILMRNLNEYIPYPTLLELKDSDENHQQYFKDFSQHLIKSFSAVQKSEFFYRDWFVKHLFYNPQTQEIAVIDLERFYSKKDLPFYYFLSAVRNYKRKKERKVLAKTLKISLEHLESQL